MQTKQPTIRQLRHLVQQAARDNPHLTSRLEKAAFLVLLRPIEPAGAGCEDYRIGSEDGLRYYEVRNGHRECSDYMGHGPGHSCKHRLALALHLTLTRQRSSHIAAGPVDSPDEELR